MSEERYLKSIKTGVVFAWTELLADRSDLIECDLAGNRVVAKAAPEPEPEPEPIVPVVEPEPKKKPVKRAAAAKKDADKE